MADSINPFGYHSGGLNQVSSASSSVCVVGDVLPNGQGYFQTYNGLTWSAPTTSIGPGTRFCVLPGGELLRRCRFHGACGQLWRAGHHNSFAPWRHRGQHVYGDPLGHPRKFAVHVAHSEGVNTSSRTHAQVVYGGHRRETRAAGTSTFTVEVIDTKATMTPHGHTTNTKPLTVTITYP